MLWNLFPSSLLAQADPDTQTRFALVLLLIAAVVIIPMVAGRFLGSWLRMPDYGWKIGVILASFASGIAILSTGQLNFGVDLAGGSILVYELEDDVAELVENGVDPEQMRVTDELISALTDRLNPAGTREIIVRAHGERQIEIVVPEVDVSDVEWVKRTIEQAGALEFRMVATRRPRHQDLVEYAREQAEDPATRLRRQVLDDEGNVLGFWARVARDDQPTPRGIHRFKAVGPEDILRHARTGEILEIPRDGRFGEDYTLAEWAEENDIPEIDVLMVQDDWNVTGDYLGVVSRGTDERMRPAVTFSLRGRGANLMRGLTSEHLPDREAGHEWRMGIVLDHRVLSAPVIQGTISDRGQITGQFTDEEISFLVGILRSGRLPATLKPEPLSENRIDSTLGAETIRMGAVAISIALVSVLVFIIVFYRFAGMVATYALVTNLILILAIMILLGAELTLPGLAGLVLTVGMSVDANVLIFERIREELNRGSGLRLAIRNGFSRATTTIVDANVTTLITALVLYAIGTDQIRGFAITLILGILMSMFTAIFCSRVIFDVAERKRWLTQLKMMQLIGQTNINFLGNRKIAFAGSLLIILVGLIAVADRREGIFDIDFRGGTSVVMALEEPQTDVQVRRQLDELFADLGYDYTVTRYYIEGEPDGTYWKIDSSIESLGELQTLLYEAFPLIKYEMEVQSVEPVVARSAADQRLLAADRALPPTTQRVALADGSPAHPPADAQIGPRTDLPPDTVLALASNSDATNDEPVNDEPATDEPTNDDGENGQDVQPPATENDQPAPEQPVAEEVAAEQPATAEEAQDEPDAPAETPVEEAEAEAAAEPETYTPAEIPEARAVLSFENHPVAQATLVDRLTDAAEQANVPIRDFSVRSPHEDWVPDSHLAFADWEVTIFGTDEQLTQIVNQLQATFNDTPVWVQASEIGAKVAGDTQQLAIYAFLASLLGIICYVWIRFQRVTFGLAAVVALVHDVLITLGAIAVSFYLAGVLGFLLIEEFKISLPVVAAFLTIIGYSLNDTIVVFDRIREVRGKSPELTEQIINKSINLTLARTLLTSLTTFLVVLILYTIGGPGIHGFAFALLVGVAVGTYSSIFIASPALLWMTRKQQEKKLGKVEGV